MIKKGMEISQKSAENEGGLAFRTIDKRSAPCDTRPRRAPVAERLIVAA